MKKTAIILIIALALALATFALSLTGCDDKDDDDDTPQPHETTITAFGKTITVTGDASIATADFTTAKGKLETAMVALANANPEGTEAWTRFTNMLNRSGFKIIIETGNASPDADANKSMIVGIDYLLNNEAVPTIALAIRDKLQVNGPFAE